MSQLNSTVVNENTESQFTLTERIYQDISYDYRLDNFINKNLGDEDILEQFIASIIEGISYHVFNSSIQNTWLIKVTIVGEYEQIDQLTLKLFIRNSKFFTASSYVDFEENVKDKITKFAIQIKGSEKTEGSVGYGKIKTIKSMSLSFISRYTYNTNNLNSRTKLVPSKLNNYINFIPINDDKLCVLHCIYVALHKQITETYFNTAEKNYNKEFLEWINKYNLLEVYNENLVLDLKKNLTKIEDKLEINIRLFEKDGDSIKKYWQSEFKYDQTVKLLIVSYSDFQNYKKELIYDLNSDKNYIPFVSRKIELSNSHCCLFKDTIFNVTDSKTKKNLLFCTYCDKSLRNEAFTEHELICKNYMRSINKQSDRLRTYKENEKTEKVFNNYASLMRVPFATFDFETRICKETNQSVLLSYSICFVNVFDLKKSFYLSNCSYNLEEVEYSLVEDLIFVSKHNYELQNVDNHNNKSKPTSTTCPLCFKENSKMEFNHSHYEGDNLNLHLETFICDKCNKKLQFKNKPLQLYAFNSKNYDNTFLLNAIFKSKLKDNRIEFLAKSASKFTTIEVFMQENHSNLLFKDSILHFPGNSLDSAIKSILVKEEHFELLKVILAQQYKNNDLYSLSKVKAPFPYDLLNDEENFSHKGNFPKELYFNSLSDSHISDSEYEKSNQIYEHLSNFKEYHDFYLLLDTVLLGCLMLTYMMNSFKETKINSLAFISSSSHAFNSFLYLNHLNKKPEKIILPPVNIQLILKKALHGGFTFVFNKKNHRADDSITTYLDATSLYPTQFLNHLPFEYIGEEDINKSEEILNSNLETGDYWYLFVSDIKPLKEEFQKKLRNYPLFPETVQIKKEWLSEDQIDRYKFNSNSSVNLDKIEKNTVTFFEKKDYHCSARYLKNALNLGYEIQEVKKIYKFKQAPIMKDFVEKFYSMKRNAALEIKKIKEDKLISEEDKNEKLTALNIQKNLAKLILNATYGSTLVDSLSFTEVEKVSINNPTRIQKLTSSFRFKDCLQTDEYFLIHKEPYKFSLNYPLMLGISILDDSKIQMSKFIMKFYDFITSKELDLQSCYCDTDSYVSSVVQNGKNVFKNKMHMLQEFNKFYNVIDMSAYKRTEFYSNENEEKLGMFTDEMEGPIEIKKAVFLCAKVYSIIDAEENVSVKSKGISKNFAKKLCNFNLYENIVDGNFDRETKLTFSMKKIENMNLSVKMIDLKKQYVTYVDVKSYYSKNSSNYLIFGEKNHLKLINE